MKLPGCRFKTEGGSFSWCVLLQYLVEPLLQGVVEVKKYKQ